MAPPRSGDHCRLQFTVSIFHVLENMRELRKRNLASDEVMRANLPAHDRVQRLADELRRMMERRFDRDFRIVEGGRIDLHFSAARATAKQIHGTALAHHLERPLPRNWLAHRFDNTVRTPAAFRELANECHGIVDLRNVEGRHRAEAFRSPDLARTLADRDHSNMPRRKNANEFQPDRTAADNYCGVAGPDSCLVNAAEDASERLYHRRIYEGNALRNLQHIFADDSPGNANVFGVGPVVEQQVLA